MFKKMLFLMKEMSLLQKKDDQNIFKTINESLNYQKFMTELSSLKLENMNNSFVRSMKTVLKKEKMGFSSIYEDKLDEYGINMFILSEGKKLPLHDHPNMVVFTKILKGKMMMKTIDFKNDEFQIKLGYDFLENKNIPDEKKTIKINTECKINFLSKGDIKTLTPIENNLHEITAIEDLIFIDFFLPNYSYENGRICNFYKFEMLEEGNYLHYLFPSPEYSMENVNYEDINN